MQHIRWSDVEVEHLNPLLDRQYFSTPAVTLARFRLRQGAVVPMHSHHNEQLSWVKEGAVRFTFSDGEPIVVRRGEMLSIPPNAPHQAEALEESQVIDVFIPARADWASHADDYLRGPK